MDGCIEATQSVEEYGIPTRICMVCECKENPQSTIAYAHSAWLCDRCKKALLDLVLKGE